MSNSRPTIFFVHGAWHQSAHYQPIINKLSADGFHALAPTQPSYGVTGPSLKTISLQDDASFIKAELTKLVDEGHQVIAVLHSYGGCVGTEAIDASLGYAQRAAQGKKGGVIRLVYMTAFMLPPESSLGDALGGSLPPFIKAEDDGSCTMEDPKWAFYNNLDDEAARPWLALCKPHATKCQFDRLTYTAYLYHPVSYIVAIEDPVLTPDVQRGMIAGVEASGLKVDVHEVAADHSPYLCKIPEVVAILEKIADCDVKL